VQTVKYPQWKVHLRVSYRAATSPAYESNTTYKKPCRDRKLASPVSRLCSQLWIARKTEKWGICHSPFFGGTAAWEYRRGCTDVDSIFLCWNIQPCDNRALIPRRECKIGKCCNRIPRSCDPKTIWKGSTSFECKWFCFQRLRKLQSKSHGN